MPSEHLFPNKSILQGPNLTLIFCSGSQHLVSCSVLVVNLVNESSRTIKQIMITTMMIQKEGLTDSVSCPTMEIPGRPITY